jgi:hypothetical protein
LLLLLKAKRRTASHGPPNGLLGDWFEHNEIVMKQFFALALAF